MEFNEWISQTRPNRHPQTQILGFKKHTPLSKMSPL